MSRFGPMWCEGRALTSRTKSALGFLNPAGFLSRVGQGNATATTFTLGKRGTLNQYFGPHLRQADLSFYKTQSLGDSQLKVQFPS